MDLTEKQLQRFWKKVNKTDSCWLWTGACNALGYGRLRLHGKSLLSHRLSWLLAGNTIPDGHIVRHICKAKNCINPDHLETGTHVENMEDKMRDGTAGFKLTIQQVRAIRAREGESYNKLTEDYGVSYKTVSDIINWRRWTKV